MFNHFDAVPEHDSRCRPVLKYEFLKRIVCSMSVLDICLRSVYGGQ